MLNRLIWIACYTYFLIGFTHIILGSILVEILNYYEKSYVDGGILISFQSIGFLAGVLLSTYLTRKISRRTTIIVASISIALSQFVFFMMLPWSIWLIVALFAGFGFGVIEPLVGSLIIDVAKEKRAIAFSKLEVFFGLGSLIMPIVTGWLAVTDLWRYAFLALGLYAVAISLIWMKTYFGELNNWLGKPKETIDNEQKLDIDRKRSNMILWSFILFFGLYVGLEITVMNFLPSILVNQLNTGILEATLSVTIFWGAMVFGRVLSGYLAERISYAKYLILSCSGSVVFIILLGFAGNIWISYIVIACIGLMMSGIFGIGIVYVDHILQGDTQRNTSIVIASGGIGGIILPFITGGMIDHFRVASVSIALGILALIMTAIIININKRSIYNVNTE
ncbi:MFS transporter [Oceanobacillus sojae]|uniref:MFS transporter n=1 Tax=Oceanobacillus sojae TaxID=582851 RepID=UPI00158F0349|nr:MFS transporter [Oceanobacillus sojae]